MNILTIDLEDWFHILDHPEMGSPGSWGQMESRIEKNTDRILDLLAKHNQRATWFCLGWVAKKYPDVIKRIAKNHDLACHSMNHQLLFLQKPAEANEDLLDNIHVLEDIGGKKITAYRAPGFSFNNQTKWIIKILAEAGVTHDCSMFPYQRNHGGYATFPMSKPCRISFKGIVIREFPMTQSSFLGKKMVFSGGGYFRVLPYMAISSMMRKSEYVMTYFHPRDFDPAQPVLKGLSMKRKFMSYVGLKNSFSKFDRLLNDYKFVTVDEASKMVDWVNTRVINLEKY